MVRPILCCGNAGGARWWPARLGSAHKGVDAVMTPPAKPGGFSGEKLLGLTAASQPTAQVSPYEHLSPLAADGPIRALKRGTPCSPEGPTARCVLRTPRFRACNPMNTSCCKGAAGSGAEHVRATSRVYSTYVLVTIT